ncbi:hypothetical protein [Streptomyces cylindrosporus]|uniref:DUF1707 domain-containing protein n=1 Tax=Streptomyces cylindrosporus TaxID=2927583 RepID=A0ABS9YPG4_9ACTN|nr:hypothetical protein [Streptomyces cylindrosporus]MCI3279107.1 hypothetical protein [Streptomyces cylindrosporus]
MNQPGHHPQPTATPAGQPHPTDRTELLKLAGEVDDALAEAIAEQKQCTAIRIEDPTIPSWKDGARIGTTPPITDQPGTRRPAMSQRAVDASTLMLSGSVAYAVVAGSTSVVLWATNFADPKVIAMLCAVPPAIAVPILATCAVLKKAKDVVAAAPADINQHYHGHVDQRSVHVHTRTRGGIVAVTRNQTPELPPANH